MPTLTLKPGREKSLLRRHPWIFSGAVAHVNGDPEPGATQRVSPSVVRQNPDKWIPKDVDGKNNDGIWEDISVPHDADWYNHPTMMEKDNKGDPK